MTTSPLKGYRIFMFFLAFTGRHQVMFGIVPIDVDHASSESCKNVYPIAIANCKENKLESSGLSSQSTHLLLKTLHATFIFRS